MKTHNHQQPPSFVINPSPPLSFWETSNFTLHLPMAETRRLRKPTKRNHHHTSQNHTQQKKQEKKPSWDALREMFSCKYHSHEKEDRKRCGRTGCSVSLCDIKESSKVTLRPGNSLPDPSKKWVPISGSRSVKAPLNEINGPVSSSSSSSHSSQSANVTSSTSANASYPGGSFRGLHLRRFSGCYECHTVVDPVNGFAKNPSLRSTIRYCSECGEIFMKAETLELHQTVKHAVSELDPEDSSRNIVEIIFQSSWLKKQAPVYKIDRILKVNNTQKTIDRFEDYRDLIKSKATRLPKKYPRCMADGNELLRFHSTSFTCSIGSNGSTNLCNSIPNCKLCSILKDGFKADGLGRIRTMATSGRAHDIADVDPEDDKRAMLVCRVIAGRIKKSHDVAEEYDSVCGPIGLHSSVDKLFVFNPKAILPCFLVIYRIFSP